MFRLSRNRFIHLWAVRIYLVTVVIATIAIMIFDLFTLETHRNASKELTESSLRLQGEKLAIELERHLWQLAEESLRNEDLLRISSRLEFASTPESTKESWAQLQSYKTAYPWVEQFLILHDDNGLSAPAQIPRAEGAELPGQRYYGKLVRSLESALAVKSVSEVGRIWPLSINTPEGKRQVYYTRLSAPDGGRTLLGFAVDLNWVSKQLLPQCKSEVHMPDDFTAYIDNSGISEKENNPAEIRTPFRTILPFCQLVLPTSAIAAGKAAASRDMIFAGISMLILVVVCVMGVLLLARLMPELKMAEIRSNFVSGVSHELKTPLTLIRLYGETLSDEEGLSAADRRAAVQVVTRESERLSQLIGNLLDLSNIERGQEKYRWTEGDLAPVVAETVEIYGRWLVQRGFLLTKDIAAELPPVRFDADKIIQVVFNLMDNARKYSTQTKAIWAGLWLEGNQVIFELQDKGIGIPLQDQKRIFQQFFRARNVQSQGGCGIGLYLVQRTMQAHGGRVEVDSQEGSGTRFRLIFPILKPATVLVRDPMPHPLAHRIS